MLDLMRLVLEEPTNTSPGGPMNFMVWIFMAVAVALLGWSLTRHLRKAEANHAAGVFGDEPEDPAAAEPAAPDEAAADEAAADEVVDENGTPRD